ncbi:PAS-domain containing protein [Sneathiella glossodoripedis]|uniref:PAS-domain containing protein n=1 Tax=Sneathiella glossodoripedis TaxID=418853 RepID=UPI0004722AF2|nr:PAS-domain containing protein [Sneathiella glossodoripedis]
MDASAISVIRAKPQQAHPQYFKSLPEQAISDGHACELISKYAQADGIHTDSFRVTSRQCYATSYIFRSRNAEETLIISLWHENLLDLNDADQIFLDMAIEACRLRIGAKYIKDFRQPHIISEAFDAVDDGFIIYDKDQQIIAYNQRQQDLFPSVTGTLQIGFEYEAILRKQLASGQLNIPDTEAEEWIERRKKQLKDHRHTEEQKFENGKTIRLTNYQTSSGGTVAVRSDITELVEARQRAVENEQLFRALLIGAPIPLFIITGMEIVYANSYAESLFDAGSEGLLS